MAPPSGSSHRRWQLAGRVLVVLVLLGGVLGLAAYYDTGYERHWPYPTADRLAADYDSAVGERAFLSGTVVERGASGRIRVHHADGSFELSVRGTPIDARPGGFVQVYGTVAPGRSFVADRVVVVNRTGRADPYKYAVSAVGVAVVGVLFVRYWRFDPRTVTFRRRDDG